MIRSICCALSVLICCSALSADDAAVRQVPQPLRPSEHGVGRLVADFGFSDLSGKPHKLSDYKDCRAVVVCLTSTSCPLSKKYLPTLVELAKTYAAKGAAFVLVNPRATDEAAAMQAAAASLGAHGAYVHDKDGKSAAAVGATTTTDVIVLDADRKIVYHGAVDDQYGLGHSLDAPRKRYLADALDALVAGRTIEVAATNAPGCALDVAAAAPQPPAVTYHNRISRIVEKHCVECHRAGGVAPFSLTSADDLKDHGPMIRQVLERGVMPPWFAAATAAGKTGPWANDRSLPAADKADLLAWLASDRVLGDPADAPRPRTFPAEWRIGTPDAIVQLPKPVKIKADGVMAYQNVVVDSGIAEDRWVQAMEIRPTAPEVVHHVLAFVLPPAGAADSQSEASSEFEEVEDERRGFFCIYVPGNSLLEYPAGFAKPFPAGSKVRFQIHYTPNGTATEDQLRLGLKFAEKKPEHIVRTIGVVDPLLKIPPGVEHHAETASLRIPTDVHVLSFLPHMHLRGAAFRYELETPGKPNEVLLDIPRYDFNWQLNYQYAEPRKLPAGATLQVTGWFDNSEKNPANPDPTATVRWGSQTYEEMLIGYVEYYTDGPGLSRGGRARLTGLGGGGQGEGSLLLRRLDADGDGMLSKAEAEKLVESAPRLNENPRLLDALFRTLDADGDGKLADDELKRLGERLRTGR